MRILGIFSKDLHKTDTVRQQTVAEGKEARKAIDEQFEALFTLMDETLKSVRAENVKGRRRKAKK